MPRKLVPLETGSIYHVYNRGVDKRTIFLDREDYLRFYKSLDFFNSREPVTSFYECSRRDTGNLLSREPLVVIHAYALLQNHFHLLLTQLCDNGISEFMKRVSGGYTSYFNEKYDRTGVLFQGKFKRAYVDSDEKFRYLAAYINYNHLIHTGNPIYEVFRTSSVVYEGKKKCLFLQPDLILDSFISPEEYRKSAMQVVNQVRELREEEHMNSYGYLFHQE